MPSTSNNRMRSGRGRLGLNTTGAEAAADIVQTECGRGGAESSGGRVAVCDQCSHATTEDVSVG